MSGFNLSKDAEWWWSGVPLGPLQVWILGSLACLALSLLLAARASSRIDQPVAATGS